MKKYSNCIDCGKKIGFGSLRCTICFHRYQVKEKHPSWKGGRPKCKKCGKPLVCYSATYCHKHAHFGENNSMFEKHHSKETRLKMRLNHADFKGENHPLYGRRGKDASRYMKIILNSLING